MRRAEIQAVVVAHDAALRSCQAAAPDTVARGKGRVLLVWAIAPDGLVRNARVEFSDFVDAEFLRCLTAEVSGWRFPRPTAGSAEVRFPFEFVPGG